jgi:hypothetical protein
VPGYKELIRKGSNATGPYSVDASKVEVLNPGSFTVWYRDKVIPPGAPITLSTQRIDGFATNLSLPGAVSTSASKAEAIALGQIYRKVRSEQEHLNSLASLAEIGDVIRQFKSPMKAVVELTHKHLDRLFKERQSLKGPLKQQKTQWKYVVSSTYLEYAFGLAPLISDTRKIAEALAHWNHDEELTKLIRRSKVVGRGEDMAVTQSEDITGVFSSDIRILRSSKDTSLSRSQYVVGLNASLSANFGSNQRLLDMLGFVPANFVPAVWEVVPWSWLVDYFTNVGDILNAMTTSTASVSWIARTVTSKSIREGVDSYNAVETNKRAAALSKIVNSVQATPAKYKVVRTTLSRTQPTTLNFPSLYFQTPSEIGQLANMVAVLFSRKDKSAALRPL